MSHNYEQETNFENHRLGAHRSTHGIRSGYRPQLLQRRQDDHQQIGVLSTWGYHLYYRNSYNGKLRCFEEVTREDIVGPTEEEEARPLHLLRSNLIMDRRFRRDSDQNN